MWIFTKRAFLSVVAYDPKKDLEKDSPFKKIAKNNKTHVLVRARVLEDIEDLKLVLPSVKIVDDIVADYKYRSVISRKIWDKYLLLASSEIDYDSHFKEVVRANATQPQKRYSAMMSVWSAMIQLQPFGKGSWGYSSSTDYDNWKPSAWKGGKGVQTIGGKSKVQDDTAEAIDVAPDDSNDPITLADAKAYILQEDKKYPDYLAEDELARCTPEAFALWVRIVGMRKQLGVANFKLDEELLDTQAALALLDVQEQDSIKSTKDTV